MCYAISSNTTTTSPTRNNLRAPSLINPLNSRASSSPKDHKPSASYQKKKNKWNDSQESKHDERRHTTVGLTPTMMSSRARRLPRGAAAAAAGEGGAMSKEEPSPPLTASSPRPPPRLTTQRDTTAPTLSDNHTLYSHGRTREIKPLAEASIRRMVAEQAISDLASAVKELVDNALDAGSKSINSK
jgi:hypothetical protein